MKSPWIESLRSVALTVPDLAAAETFYTQVWRLSVADRGDRRVYLRGGGDDHHLLALHQRAGAPQILKVTLRARSAAALADVTEAAPGAGGALEQGLAAAQDPAGGQAVVLRDAHVLRYDVIHGDARRSADDPPPCDMPTLDAVMRGGGRMQDAGHGIEWGPGRHGLGDNAFNSFIDPFGIVIEYTAEVAQIDDSYLVPGPSDWTWPPGRVDQWGISAPPSARLKEAQRAVHFARSL